MVAEDDDDHRSSSGNRHDEGSRASELVGDREHHATSEQEFTLQAHWLKPAHSKDDSARSVANEVSYMGVNSVWGGMAVEPDSKDMQSHKGSKEWFPQYPNSESRILWDCVSAMLVIYDVAMLPLAVFQFQRNDFVISMGWITLIFWTINMPKSLCVGYVAHGKL
ncbi:unnamed protein product [Prorocentrum cordatum]|uniref:Uncharacterized protein n=1 Tax=Prorocentrum cordatum TaxID=2364126 RepID=A0ABN9VYP4_9DINO|nr:unnamed protein product [Polarella glacialis]